MIAALRIWWAGFKARHVVAADPDDAAREAAAVRTQDVLAREVSGDPPPVRIVYPHPCRRPDKTVRYPGPYTGQRVDGWRILAKSDAARVAVLWEWERHLPPLTHKETA